MLRLAWAREARTDLRRIIEYINSRYPAAADRLQELIEQSAERLPDHPFLHRSGRVHGTCEAVVHPKYILIYRVEVDVVRVMAVFHARQQYP